MLNIKNFLLIRINFNKEISLLNFFQLETSLWLVKLSNLHNLLPVHFFSWEAKAHLMIIFLEDLNSFATALSLVLENLDRFFPVDANHSPEASSIISNETKSLKGNLVILIVRVKAFLTLVVKILIGGCPLCEFTLMSPHV